MNIFPNPVKSVLNVQFPTNNKHTSIKVYSSAGQNVFDKTFSDCTQIDFSSFAKGTYYIDIENETIKQFSKIIKE